MEIPKKKIFHGWIVVQKEEGYNPNFLCQEKNATGATVFHSKSAAIAIEWWDAKVGENVSLLETPLHAYRVYTEKEIQGEELLRWLDSEEWSEAARQDLRERGLIK